MDQIAGLGLSELVGPLKSTVEYAHPHSYESLADDRLISITSTFPSAQILRNGAIYRGIFERSLRSGGDTQTESIPAIQHRLFRSAADVAKAVMRTDTTA